MGFRRPQGHPGYPDYPPPGADPQEPEVILRQVSPTRFQLLHGFCYDREGAAESYDVPAHDPYDDPKAENNSTDLASVPPLLLWFIGTYGLHTKAALFHDHYVDATDDRQRRKHADTVFRDALRESGVRWLRRWLMWTAVSLRTSVGAVGMVVVVGHLLALAATTASWVLGWLPWWTPLVVGIAGFVWGLHRWPLAIVGFALVALPAALAFVSRLIAWLTELVEEVFVVANAKRTGVDRSFETPAVNPSAKKSL